MGSVVPTIDNGDCLFAAFAIAFKGEALATEQQRRLARVLRIQAVTQMAKPAFWRDVIAPILDQADVARLLCSRVPSALINAAMTFPARGARKAYISIMKTAGTWGGHLEIKALSQVYKVRVVLVGGTGEFTAAGHRYNKVIKMAYSGNHYSGIV
jgi:hypothetical protein